MLAGRGDPTLSFVLVPIPVSHPMLCTRNTIIITLQCILYFLIAFLLKLVSLFGSSPPQLHSETTHFHSVSYFIRVLAYWGYSPLPPYYQAYMYLISFFLFFILFLD